MLKFVLPAEENADDILSFYNEFEEEKTSCIGFEGYKDIDRWITK